MTWFWTADLHLEHPAIIKHCNRPFGSVLEMNITLMENWNRRVGKNDIVVVLGDFCWSTDRKYVNTMFINRLNGSKIFVKGNHDYWLSEKRHMYNKKFGDFKVYGSHYALRSWPSGFNFHGHSHGTLVPFYNQLLSRKEGDYIKQEDYHVTDQKSDARVA